MARRRLLTDEQWAGLLALPNEERDIVRHYTLGPDELAVLAAKRTPHNRLGYALLLCAMRHPGRTAVTASALMIGVALVTLVTVIAQGLRDTTTGTLENRINATHVITGSDGWTGRRRPPSSTTAAPPPPPASLPPDGPPRLSPHPMTKIIEINKLSFMKPFSHRLASFSQASRFPLARRKRAKSLDAGRGVTKLRNPSGKRSDSDVCRDRNRRKAVPGGTGRCDPR